MPFFPLLVEETVTHVVFYEADDQDQALRMAKEDPGSVYACLGKDSQAHADLTVSAPETDWEHALVREPSSFGYKGQAAAA
jgi:hypothetical protein